MADTYYAWGEIHTSGDAAEDDSVKKVKPGDTVSASDLGVSDEDFEALVESGAVRTEEYPELPEGYTGSPAQYAQEQAVAQAQVDEAQGVLDQASGKSEEEAPAATPTRATQAKAEK